MTRHLLLVAALLLAAAPAGVVGQPLPTPLEMIADGGETVARRAPSASSAASAPSPTPASAQAVGVGRTVGLWLTYELARQRDVLLWETTRLVGRIPASAGLLLLPAAGLLGLSRRRETDETAPTREPEPALSRAERARMLLESGVATTDAARETRMAREGLDLLLRLSGSARPVSTGRRNPWGGSVPPHPPSTATAPGYATYRRTR